MRKPTSPVILSCGDQIRLHPVKEKHLRALAAKLGREIGPIRTLDDYLEAVWMATPDNDKEVLLAIHDNVSEDSDD